MSNIITISGDPASGKSTVAEALKKQFEMQGKEVVLYSTGDIMRRLAREKQMSITEFNQYLEKSHCDVDQSIDSGVANLGKKITEENDQNKIYIIVSRLAWFNIPSSFKVRITTSELIAGKRCFEDQKRGEEDKFPTIEVAIEKTRERKQSEMKRYIDIYGKGADISNDDNFDLVINNSTISKNNTELEECINEIAELIINARARQQVGRICKHWANPQIFLPTQNIRQTGEGFEEIVESIKEHGYFASEDIGVIKVDDFYFVNDGHHRCYAAARAGVKFIPYFVEAKDDEHIGNSKYTAREIIEQRVKDKQYYNSTCVYPIEDLIHFRYTDYYPNAYKLNEVLCEKTPIASTGEPR